MVNPDSKVTASLYVDLILSTHCLGKWTVSVLETKWRSAKKVVSACWSRSGFCVWVWQHSGQRRIFQGEKVALAWTRSLERVCTVRHSIILAVVGSKSWRRMRYELGRQVDETFSVVVLLLVDSLSSDLLRTVTSLPTACLLCWRRWLRLDLPGVLLLQSKCWRQVPLEAHCRCLVFSLGLQKQHSREVSLDPSVSHVPALLESTHVSIRTWSCSDLRILT